MQAFRNHDAVSAIKTFNNVYTQVAYHTWLSRHIFGEDLFRGVLLPTACRIAWPDVVCHASIRVLLAVVALTRPDSYELEINPQFVSSCSHADARQRFYFPYPHRIELSLLQTISSFGSSILVIALFRVKLHSKWHLHRVVIGALKAALFAHVSYILLHASK